MGEGEMESVFLEEPERMNLYAFDENNSKELEEIIREKIKVSNKILGIIDALKDDTIDDTAIVLPKLVACSNNILELDEKYAEKIETLISEFHEQIDKVLREELDVASDCENKHDREKRDISVV